MSSDKQFTRAEVKAHDSKKDLYLVVHDKVYDVSGFVDEHPGGEEVLLDVAGEDSTEAFEDVGHSDEAREILEGYLVGTIKRMPGDPAPSAPKAAPPAAGTESSGSSVGVYAVLVLVGAVTYGVYQYLATAAGV